ncbi:anti-sigma regulatory factor [Occallatibacter savannae]|uniref:anti-sigma regulatory factor n=1 Tax=Occallatibacter savannae TaxID=1002691 RepID=UPI000D6998E1|nr:anti-sigma regulatory factor [Occallatibacter savannae]
MSSVQKREVLPVKTSNDVVIARQKVRQLAVELRFSLVDQTKLVTAASELARNALDHGKGGTMTVEVLVNGARSGLKMVFEDQGPGIANIEDALKDGFTTGAGMGLGLGGSKRLVNDFSIETEVGKGTRITAVRWR